MIFEGALAWLGMVFAWVVGQVPGLPTPPAFFTQGVAQVGQLMGVINGFCSWVDFGLAKQAVVVVVGAWLVGIVIRVVRIALGFFIG